MYKRMTDGLNGKGSQAPGRPKTKVITQADEQARLKQRGAEDVARTLGRSAPGFRAAKKPQAAYPTIKK